MQDYVRIAYKIARNAYKGQKDKAGKDYLRHLEFVSDSVKKEDEKTGAFLHDVLEDTNVAVDHLRTAKIPEAVIEAVETITKHQGEEYFAYLLRVKQNFIARKVKLADLQHNSDLTRLAYLSNKDRQRLSKYREARDFFKKNLYI